MCCYYNMIIPVRCVSCGFVLANKYRYWQAEVRRKKLAAGINPDNVIYFNKNRVEKTPEAICMEEIGITNICCKRHILTHVDIE